MHHYPNTRLRRPRMASFSRCLLQEHQLSPQDLIYPVFVLPGSQRREPIPGLPGLERLSIDYLCQAAKRWHALGIQAINLYPCVPAELKTEDGREAFNPDGLAQKAIHSLKAAVPSLGIISDVALDPFTSHGHDGVMDKHGKVLNDPSLEILVKQALSHAAAGADIIAPSDMMDGRVGAIREALEVEGFTDTLILSYTAKYASGYYAPFRQALGSAAGLGKKDKSSYQMNPANQQEALMEADQDLKEGADILMVKPASHYLDILYLLQARHPVPVFAFQVSGEYAMQKLAIEQGLLSTDIVLESLLCLKRAGARAILSYFAIEVAENF